MAKIVKDAEPFERFSLPVAEARQFVADLGQTLQGRAHRRRAAQVSASSASTARASSSTSAAGPHIPHAGKVGAFKLLSIAGAYWKGQTDRKMLQRVYGTAFFDKKELDAYLAQVEEAKKRDHRKLGKELEPVHDLAAGRLGPDPLDAQGGDRPRHPRELHQGRADQARLSAGLHARTSARSSCTRPAATIPYYRDSQFPPLKMPADAAAMELLDGLSTGDLDDDAQRDACSARPASPSGCRDPAEPDGAKPTGQSRRTSR